MNKPQAMKAVIAGGGIGGLTAALALHHFGWEVTVLEQDAAPHEGGAGIQLSPNGVKVLRALGLERAMQAQAFAPQALEMRLGRSGRSLFRLPLGARLQARWGAGYWTVHRGDVVQILRRALAARAPRAFCPGARVAGYAADARQAAAILADGTEQEGDLLVGADGVHSALRAQMLGANAPRFTGHVAWRALVPLTALGAHAPPPTACVWVGTNRHAVTYRVRRGACANFVGVVAQQQWRSESWRAQGSRADALADFGDWHPILRRLLEKAPAHYRWALFDRAPLARWSEGRVVLLGDACHPMLPFMAQGAVMAMEDGWLLARLCREGQGDIARALAGFYRRRIARTAAAQAASRRNGALLHGRGLGARLLTTAPWLTQRAAPRLLAARLDRFYGYDVTA